MCCVLFMKKYLFILWLCATSSLYAFEYSHGAEAILKISIKNNTPDSCDLLNQTLIRGEILSLMPVPDAIPSGHEKVFFILDHILYGSDIILTYACGAGERFITFRSHKVKSLVPWEGLVMGDILRISNLDATDDVLSSIFGVPGSIYWTLN